MFVVGLDGVYAHAKGQRSRAEGWFEVIVGKSLPMEDKCSKCFGFVSRYGATPKQRLFEWLEAQAPTGGGTGPSSRGGYRTLLAFAIHAELP